MKRTVVVLGRSRSGTSMIAGILAKLGVDMRETNNDSCIHNPKGAFENESFVAMTSDMYDGKFADVIPLIEPHVAQRNSESDLWGFKSALTHRCIDHFMPYLINPHFIYVFRNPVGIAVSEAHVKSQRPGQPGYEPALHDSIEQTGEDLKVLAECMKRYQNIPSLWVQYEQTRDSFWTFEIVTKIAEFLGVEEKTDFQDAINIIETDYCSADEYRRIESCE